MARLLVVDGSNLLFQMFFGMPARIVNHEGKAIQGTLGFVGALRKIIARVQPTHAVVLFDGQAQNARTAIDEQYKANRIDYSTVPAEENPFSQLMDVYAALDCMGIRHAETTDCEADDWMAAYAVQYGRDMEVVISSFDSDLFQLISDRVSVLRYRGEKSVVCTPEYIMEKFGIGPKQYADLKAMTGDKADNIRGAEKVGPKTAAALLNRFGDLDGVLVRAAEIPKQSVRESILRNGERLRKNRELILLDGSAGVPFAVDELVWRGCALSTGEILQKIGLR